MKPILSLFLSLVPVAASLFGLEPPDEAQLQELLETGHLERRIAAAYEYGNHVASESVVGRVGDLNRRVAARATGAPMQLSQKLPEDWAGVSPQGDANVLVFLIDFADHRASEDFPGLTKSRVHQNIFGEGTPEAQAYAPWESMRNFYQRASNGRLNIKGETHGWYHFEKHQADYKPLDSDSDNYATWQIVKEVLVAYDPVIDYSSFDKDEDGYVDALNILWCGEIGEWASFWWGYRSMFYLGDVSYFELDGVRFSDFSWQWVETRTDNPTDYDPRVLTHEFGHLLGLPDLYDYEPWVGPEGGVGGSDLMDSSRSGNMNAYFRWLLGWIDPEVHLVGDAASIILSPAGRVHSENPALAVYLESPPGGLHDPLAPFSELLLIENRQEEGNDAGIAVLPTGGLYFWQVDGTLGPDQEGFLYDNSRTDHKLIRLIQRDGLQEIEQHSARADENDLYGPGDALSPWTSPESSSNTFTPSRLVIDNIEALPDGSFSLQLSSYAGPMVRVQPASIQMRSSPGVRHPPSTVFFSSEGYSGTLQPDATDLLEVSPSIQLSGDSEVSQYLYWQTANKPLHMTLQSLVFRSPDGAVPPISVPVQMVVRIPLDDALDYPEAYWDTGRHRPWYGQELVVDSPPFAAASGDIRDGQQSYLMGYVYGAGTISFSMKVSSELDHDFVRLQVDNETLLTLSGEHDWQRYSFEIHNTEVIGGSLWKRIRWVYSKDDNGSAGDDKVYIDDFRFDGRSPEFKGILDQVGMDPVPGAVPFADGRTLAEHFAFKIYPDKLSELGEDVEWPQYELVPGKPVPLLRIHYIRPYAFPSYAPQGSPDGLRWFSLVDGEEGVRIVDLEQGTFSPGFVEVPIYGYRFFRVKLDVLR